MAGMQDEFARRWNRKPPRHVDYHRPGFEVPRCCDAHHFEGCTDGVPGCCSRCPINPNPEAQR